MKYRYLSDSHVHSSHSPDASDSVALFCEHAERLGLYSITVTDHCECNDQPEIEFGPAIEASVLETRGAAASYSGKVHIYSGVEMGEPVQNPQVAQAILDSCKFDFVLASVHNIRNKRDFYELNYNTENINLLLDRYFDEILETIQWGNFDSLAHLTYPWRYIVGEHSIAIPYRHWADRMETVLKALISADKAMEVNTSGFRQKLGTSMPDLPVIRRYRELGGRLITLGSDAHRWADLGNGLERGMQLLQQAGFSHFTVYDGREPKFLPIN